MVTVEPLCPAYAEYGAQSPVSAAALDEDPPLLLFLSLLHAAKPSVATAHAANTVTTFCHDIRSTPFEGEIPCVCAR